MPTYTQAERSRLQLLKMGRLRPESILYAIDEIKKLTNEALKGSIEKVEREALEKISSKLERYYNGILGQQVNTFDKKLEEFDYFVYDAKKKISSIKPPKPIKPTKEELLLIIEPLIPVVKDGDPGKTPTAEQLLDLIRPVVQETLENTKPTVKDIQEKEKVHSDKLEGIIKNEVAKKISEVKRYSGGGSGDRVVAGTNITLTTDILGRKKINSSGGGHTVQEEGTGLTQRANLNFVGSGVTATDDSANDATIVTISSSGGSGGGLEVEIPTGDVDSSNKSFTVTAEPLYIVSDGTVYFASNGYTYSGGTVTMDVSPSSYIRAILTGLTIENPTGDVDSVNKEFTVTAEPKFVVADGATYFGGAGYTYSSNTVTMDISPSIFIRVII